MKFTTKALRTLRYNKLSASECPKCLIGKFLYCIFFLSFSLNLWAQPLTLSQQADSQFELKQFDSAIVGFNQVIADYPAKKEGYFNRGLCYYRMNKLDSAQRDFNTCLQIDSVFEDALFMKILTLQKQGDWNGASNAFKMLDTNYTGYNELKKHIRYHNISVLLSRKWYYMIAIMFLFIILVGVVTKSYAVRKGY
jgi:tetratricopeptide (TPR) repeat protein